MMNPDPIETNPQPRTWLQNAMEMRWSVSFDMSMLPLAKIERLHALRRQRLESGGEFIRAGLDATRLAYVWWLVSRHFITDQDPEYVEGCFTTIEASIVQQIHSSASPSDNDRGIFSDQENRALLFQNYLLDNTHAYLDDIISAPENTI